MKNSFKKSFETFFRKNLKWSYPLFFVPMILICLMALSLSLILPVGLYFLLTPLVPEDFILKVISWAGLIPLLYLAYGISCITICPLLNYILNINKFVKNFSGNMYSVESIFWYLHNAFTYIPRYTFLDFICPSPLLNLFYKMMGMKVGKNVIINTTNISDPCLIEIGDNCIIGGSAHLLAHYGLRGNLTINPLVIGKKTTIGLKATVFGSNTIGENSLIGPHVVVLPKSSIPPNSKVVK